MFRFYGLNSKWWRKERGGMSLKTQPILISRSSGTWWVMRSHLCSQDVFAVISSKKGSSFSKWHGVMRSRWHILESVGIFQSCLPAELGFFFFKLNFFFFLFFSYYSVIRHTKRLPWPFDKTRVPQRGQQNAVTRTQMHRRSTYSRVDWSTLPPEMDKCLSRQSGNKHKANAVGSGV